MVSPWPLRSGVVSMGSSVPMTAGQVRSEGAVVL